MRKFFFVFLIFSLLGPVIVTGQDPATEARQLYLDYQVAWEQGDFDQAESCLKRILEGGYELSDYRMALVHNALGLLYYETGKYEEAIRQCLIAEIFCAEAGAQSTRAKISVYNNLGLCYSDRGDYINAIDHYEKAIRLLDSVQVSHEVFFDKLSMLQFNKGIVYYYLGRYEDALHILKESERIKEIHNHPYRGSVYFNIALVYQMLGKPDLSRHNFEKSIHKWISEFDSAYYQLGNVYLNFGRFLIEEEDGEEGIRYLHMALQNYISNYGIKHPLTSGCYQQIADYYLEKSDYPRAMEYIQQSLIAVCNDFSDTDFFSNPSGENSTEDLTLLKNLATKVKVLDGLSREQDKADQKLKFMNAALETNKLSIEVVMGLQESYLSRESRIFLTSGQKELFTEGIRLRLKIFGLTGEESYKEDAFLTASRGKSFELLFEMKQKERLFLESYTDSLVVSALALKQKIDNYSNLIQIESHAFQPDSQQISRWQEEVFNTRRSYNQNLEKILQDHPQKKKFKTIGTEPSMKRIRKNLGRKGTLVEYFISGPDLNGLRNLFVFMVSGKKCDFYQDTLEDSFEQNLDRVIRDLHQFVPYRESVQHFDSLKCALFDLYGQLIHPIEPYFAGHHLIIVPDEELAYLPFDALIDSYEPEPFLNYPGLTYLVNHYNITYAYNSQIIERGRPPGIRLPEITAFLPDYSFPVRSGVTYLEGASREVNKILKIVDGKKISGSLDKTEMIRWMEGEGILHFAMHARAGDEFEGSPYLILDISGDSAGNNRLYDYEINALNLSSPMVILSACETGGGWFRSGEGILSLSRSFLQAGSESVIHTLWPVEDVSGGKLMYDYYFELKKGKSKSRAISRAKRKYLASTPPSFTHPYYWAAYQVTGDPSPLVICRRVFLILIGVVIISLTGYLVTRRSFRRSV